MKSSDQSNRRGPRYLSVELPSLETLRWTLSLIRLTWVPLLLAVSLGWIASVLSVLSSSLLGYVVSQTSNATAAKLGVPAKLLNYLQHANSPAVAALWVALGMTVLSSVLTITVDWTSPWVHLIMNRRLTPVFISKSIRGLPEYSLDAATAVQRWLCKRDVVYFLTDSLAAPIRDIGTIIIAIAATYRANRLAGHVSIGFLLVWLASGAFLTFKALKASKDMARAHEMVGRIIRDGTSLRKDLSRPSLIRHWVQKSAPSQSDLQQTILWQGFWSVLLAGLLSTVAVAMPISAVLAASVAGDLGTMLAILLYLTRVGTPLQSLARVLPWFQQNLITLRRVHDVTGTPIPTGSVVSPIKIENTGVEIVRWAVRVDEKKCIHYPEVQTLRSEKSTTPSLLKHAAGQSCMHPANRGPITYVVTFFS